MQESKMPLRNAVMLSFILLTAFKTLCTYLIAENNNYQLSN